jgi:hypothetical protein
VSGEKRVTEHEKGGEWFCMEDVTIERISDEEYLIAFTTLDRYNYMSATKANVTGLTY